MRKSEGTREKIICNCCGRELSAADGMLREGCFFADCRFGYFSRRDGVRHTWELCEDCYDKIIKTFVIPPRETEDTELL